MGTTEFDLRAEVTRADPLQLSALIVGVQENGAFSPRLEFGRADAAAIGLLEIYGAPADGNVAVQLAMTPASGGNPIATAEATVSPTKTADMRTAFGGFDISRMPDGDYIMRATVMLAGRPVGVATRAVRKRAW
jgi:hypothetical protein